MKDFELFKELYFWKEILCDVTYCKHRVLIVLGFFKEPFWNTYYYIYEEILCVKTSLLQMILGFFNLLFWNTKFYQ
jgi:hypothetical protein